MNPYQKRHQHLTPDNRFIWREGELCQRTTEEVLEDRPRRCDACRNLLTREELRRKSCLCTGCAAVIDRQTEELLERAHWEDQ